MSSVGVDAKAVTALGDRLDAVGDKLTATTGLTDPAAALVAQLAGPLTPRRTGRLAGSVSVGDGGVRWGVGYAVFVNFGTRTMRAQPFASDALAAAEPQVETMAAQWAADILEGT